MTVFEFTDKYREELDRLTPEARQWCQATRTPPQRWMPYHLTKDGRIEMVGR